MGLYTWDDHEKPCFNNTEGRWVFSCARDPMLYSRLSLGHAHPDLMGFYMIFMCQILTQKESSCTSCCHPRVTPFFSKLSESVTSHTHTHRHIQTQQHNYKQRERVDVFLTFIASIFSLSLCMHAQFTLHELDKFPNACTPTVIPRSRASAESHMFTFRQIDIHVTFIRHRNAREWCAWPLDGERDVHVAYTLLIFTKNLKSLINIMFSELKTFMRGENRISIIKCV